MISYERLEHLRGVPSAILNHEIAEMARELLVLRDKDRDAVVAPMGVVVIDGVEYEEREGTGIVASDCAKCCFDGLQQCRLAPCSKGQRTDGRRVYYVRRDSAKSPPKPAPAPGGDKAVSDLAARLAALEGKVTELEAWVANTLHQQHNMICELEARAGK